MDFAEIIIEVEEHRATAWQKAYSAVSSIVQRIGSGSECVTLPTISFCVRVDSVGNVMFNNDGTFKFAEEFDDATMFDILNELVKLM